MRVPGKNLRDHVAFSFIRRILGLETSERQCCVDEVVLRGTETSLCEKVPAFYRVNPGMACGGSVVELNKSVALVSNSFVQGYGRGEYQSN